MASNQLDTVVHTTGVPRGSILEPYFYDSSFVFNYHQYADDSQLSIAFKMNVMNDILILFACADAVTGWYMNMAYCSFHLSHRP
jgi:hypothetical protein